MDIAKYIGLFLLKNHYCYIHGLGNMELVKRPATHDGKALQPPSYEVQVTPGGSIDDNLANFIATNEQISISKAANTLREYSIQARKDMAEGKEVPIPHIGHFIEGGGRVKFVTDANFRYTPAGIPTIKNSKQLDEKNSRLQQKPSYPEPHKADSINWSMVILVAVLLIILAGGGYGIYYYMKSMKAASAPVTVAPKDTVVQAPATVATPDSTKLHDTTSVAATPSVSAAVADTAKHTYKMIIGDYPELEKAEKRMRNLKINGNRADIMPKDSGGYYVFTNIKCFASDTAHVKDSLRILFGYKKVAISNK